MVEQDAGLERPDINLLPMCVASSRIIVAAGSLTTVSASDAPSDWPHDKQKRLVSGISARHVGHCTLEILEPQGPGVDAHSRAPEDDWLASGEGLASIRADARFAPFLTKCASTPVSTRRYPCPCPTSASVVSGTF